MIDLCCDDDLKSMNFVQNEEDLSHPYEVFYFESLFTKFFLYNVHRIREKLSYYYCIIKHTYWVIFLP